MIKQSSVFKLIRFRWISWLQNQSSPKFKMPVLHNAFGGASYLSTKSWSNCRAVKADRDN